MKIAVIGGGIIGLTTALTLQESGHKTTVYSKHKMADITSSVAAAMIYPYGVEDTPRVQDWLRASDAVFEDLKNIPESGVAVTHWKKCAQHETTPIPDFFYALRGARALKQNEIPNGFAKGVGADIFMANTAVHLPYILKRFQAAGGVYELRDVRHFDALSGYDVIINAAGVYAADLTGDSALQPGRGQVVVVRNPDFPYHFSSFEGRHYIYPRGAECILGGSMDIGAWDRTPDPDLTQKILQWAGDFDKRFQGVEVLDVKVGLRPMRPSVRLEWGQGTHAHILHHYGHGGAGYTLAWGCALQVRDMVARR